MGKIIRVGIIGFGRSGYNIHAEYLMQIPRKFKVIAVAEPIPDRREIATRELGCDTYASWRSMLRRDDLDLIVVAGPSHQHVRQSLTCLEAGFHVLCEKPLARKVSEVDALIRASKKSKRIMAPFHNSRYDPLFVQIRKLLESGVFGRIVMIKGKRNAFRRRWDWQTLRSHYGGNLLNVGLHQLDQLLVLSGMDIVPAVTCFMDRVLTYGDAEDHVKLLLQKRGYPVVDLEVSSCSIYPQDTFSIYGSRGGLRSKGSTVEWQYFNMKRQSKHALSREPISDANGRPIYCSDNIKWTKKEWKSTEDDNRFCAIGGYYNMLYNALIKGTELSVTLGEVRVEAAIIQECYKQNPVGRMPAADV